MANAILLEPMVPAAISMFGSLLGFDFTGGAMPAGASIASAAGKYYTTSSGLMATAPANTGRLDYDPITHAARGILIEPAATNLALQSQTLEATPWGAGGGGSNPAVTANAINAPDGTLTADRITPGTTTGNQHRTQNITLPAAGVYTISAFLKPNSYTKAELGAAATGTFPTVFFDLAAGTISQQAAGITNATIQPAANGWFYCTATYTADAAHLTSQQHSFAITLGNSIGFTGDGTSNGYAWQYQVEAGAVATSPIVTTSATATRTADVLTLNWASLGVPDGSYTLRYTFDDNSTQDVATVISGGTSTVPTTLNRPWIKKAQVLNFASPNLDLGVATNLLNDYAGVVAQTSCTVGATNQAKIQLDMGANVSVDTILVFGVELFPTNGNLIVNYATQAQGPFTGAFSTDTSGSAYAGSAPMTTGKGVSLWMLSAPVTARYFQIVYEAGAGVGGKSVRASRVAIGQRIQLQRNFSYGGGPGVKDLGTMDFSRRGVIMRAIGKKLRILSLTFSNIKKDELQASIRPLLERQGITGPIAVVTDPAVDADRQNRCYFGTLVGDLGAVQRNAVAYEAKTNLVSLF
jgi:hypothetical protein